MNKRDFFLKALRAGACTKRAWINSVFTVVMGQAAGYIQADYPYRITLTEEGMFFTDPEAGELTRIDDYVPGQALCAFLEEIIIQPGDMGNYDGPGELSTTYGNCLVNHLILVLPFGNTIGFIKGFVNIEKQVESKIIDLLIDDPEDDDGESMAPDGKIYVRQYLKFCDNAFFLMGFASLIVCSVTPKTFTGHPLREKIKAELMEEYKDRLDDPAIIAKIGNILEELDIEHLKDDESYEFYMSKYNKFVAGARKKMFYHFGGESPFTDGTTVEYISKPLEQGIDTDHMAVMNNSTRAGSYNRGEQTKLGGEATKTMYRMLGAARIVEEDCGTKVGIPTVIDKRNSSTMTGFYVLENGENILLTKDNIGSYVGKVVDMRGPMVCKTGRNEETGEAGKGKNICEKCAGIALSEMPNGLAAAAANLGGRFLTLFLKKMHAGSLKVAKWDFRKRIS